ncbi:GDSL-type esterase/lipase family protein [Caproiciproducens sp. CPB-2]|uniref:GDSL-type esterase/lipase family protein n=1 Tax=Caproiciproducens sp. CPB-2 TaxID=3030017 RepID=UPI0023DCC72F|nr:GDSL-type esterase/lipase family protein [Caproiciproducens sp. CPB-2]MDF1493215.1 GDSL-type esterase/lipase family protein [Caproiciproducens sp. CPB-2]
MNHNKNYSRRGLVLLTAGLLLLSGCGGNKQASSSAAPASSAIQSAVSSAVSSQEASSSQTPPSSSQPENSAAVQESAKADASYLDDAVFIGDSVSLKLKNYVTAKRKTEAGFFGKAQFLAAGSMGSGNALKPLGTSSIHPAYNGKKALLEDNVAAMGAKRVYIMLGANDLALYGIDGSVENMSKLLAKIQEKSPDAKLFVQSATPIIKEQQMTTLNNPNLSAYDAKLAEMCKKNGYYYIDVASVMRDSEGNLIPEYCSDPNDLGIHFTDKACQVWIDYILTHTVK